MYFESKTMNLIGSCGFSGLPSFILSKKNLSDKLTMLYAFRKMYYVGSLDFELTFYLLFSYEGFIVITLNTLINMIKSHFNKCSANGISVNNHALVS
jgi:hypothetical protein